MNPFLDRLQPYAFERLNALKAKLKTKSKAPHVALSMGEPKHAAPDFIQAALADADAIRESLGTYPPIRGSDALRAAIAGWIERRFGATLDPGREVLPVCGTREALFSFGQAVLSGRPLSNVVMPNPAYQIYEGTALLRGAEPYYVALPGYDKPGYDKPGQAGPGNNSSDAEDPFAAVPEEVWRNTELVYLCSPDNPTGYVTPMHGLVALIERARRHGFVIAADECYSEIYPKEDSPPPGLLQAAEESGLGLANCVVFHSLSKRSNLPGLRSGFVAGDGDLIARYFDYRTYHGCALPAIVSRVSELAWGDEAHVVANRTLYRAKFEAVRETMAAAFGAEPPQGGFYYWPETPIDDVEFAARLFQREHITVLPGSFLAREFNGVNPGARRVRIALVAPLETCIDAVERLADFTRTL